MYKYHLKNSNCLQKRHSNRFMQDKDND